MTRLVRSADMIFLSAYLGGASQSPKDCALSHPPSTIAALCLPGFD